MTFVKLSPTRGLNLDLVATWEYHEDAAPADEPPAGEAGDETAATLETSRAPRRSSSGRFVAAPESQTPEPETPSGRVEVIFLDGRLVTYEGVDALRLYRYLNSRSGLLA